MGVLTGFEPMTFSVFGGRSTGLSYGTPQLYNGWGGQIVNTGSFLLTKVGS